MSDDKNQSMQVGRIEFNPKYPTADPIEKLIDDMRKRYLFSSYIPPLIKTDNTSVLTTPDTDAKDTRIQELETALREIELYCVSTMTISSYARVAGPGGDIHRIAYEARTGNTDASPYSKAIEYTRQQMAKVDTNALDSLVDAQEHGDGYDKGDNHE